MSIGIFDLHGEDVPDSAPRTECTDGDWAWLLIRFADLYFPTFMETVATNIRSISERRVRMPARRCSGLMSATEV